MDTATEIIMVSVILGVALLIGLLAARGTIKDIIHARKIPTTWISALPNSGLAQVIGQAGPATGASAICQKPCVAWQFEVEEFRRGKNYDYWETVYKRSSIAPFEIGDGTGKIVVQPEGADLVLRDGGEMCESLGPEDIERLHSLEVPTSTWYRPENTIRITERVLTPGQEVYVSGQLLEVEGVKAIGWGNTAFTISDSEGKSILNVLYLRLAKYLFFALGGGILLLLLIYSFKQ